MKSAAIPLRIFWCLFAGAMVLVACVVFSQRQVAALPYFILALSLIVVFQLLCRWQKASRRLLLGIFFFCFALFAFFQLRHAFTAYVTPRAGDLGAVYDGVRELLTHGRLVDNELYFVIHPHQRMVLFQLYCFCRLMIPLGMDAGQPFLAYGGMAAVGIDIAILLFVLTIRLHRGGRAALAAGFTTLLISPLCYAATHAYTHILSLPYLFAFLFLFSLAQRVEKKANRVLFTLLSGAFLGLSALMAGEGYIALVAVFIFLLLRHGLRRCPLWSCLFLLSFFMVVFLFNTAWRMLGYTSGAGSYENELPLTHWILMGLAPNGVYEEETYQASVAIEGKAEKQAWHLQQIKQTLQEMGPSGMLTHLWSKLKITWAAMPYTGSPLPRFFSGGLFSSGLLAAFALLGIAAATGQFQRPQAGLTFFAALCLLGIFLFLLLWETNPTYYFAYLLFFVPVAQTGVDTLASWASGVFSKHFRPAPTGG